MPNEKKLSDRQLAALLALDAADAALVDRAGPVHGDVLADGMAQIWRPVSTASAHQAARYLMHKALADGRFDGEPVIRYEITDLGREAAAAARMADQWPALRPGDPIPPVRNGGQDGYVAGECGHRVAASEWRAGLRNCERCGG
jgi:hypothetical protein